MTAMTEIASPVYAPIVNAESGQAVRFFAPRPGLPDVPWVCQDDVLAASGLTAFSVRAVLDLYRVRFEGRYRSIRTTGGDLVTADYMATATLLTVLHGYCLCSDAVADAVMAAMQASQHIHFANLCKAGVLADADALNSYALAAQDGHQPDADFKADLIDLFRPDGIPLWQYVPASDTAS